VQNFEYYVRVSTVSYAGYLALWIQNSFKMPSMGWTDKGSIKNFGWGNLFEKGY